MEVFWGKDHPSGLNLYCPSLQTWHLQLYLPTGSLARRAITALRIICVMQLITTATHLLPASLFISGMRADTPSPENTTCTLETAHRLWKVATLSPYFPHNRIPILGGVPINGPIIDRGSCFLINRLHTQTDFSPIVNGKNLDFDLIAFPHDIRHRGHPSRR